MKNLFYVGLILVLFAACQEPAPQQYFTESPEIDMVKANMKNYLAGDWAAMKAAYADNAKVSHNSTTEVSSDEAIDAIKELLSGISEYKWVDPIFYEMIVEADSDKWVYFWGTWQGKLAANGQEISIPVHVALQVADGKFVEEHGYWDNQPIFAAMQELQVQEEATGEGTEE